MKYITNKNLLIVILLGDEYLAYCESQIVIYYVDKLVVSSNCLLSSLHSYFSQHGGRDKRSEPCGSTPIGGANSIPKFEVDFVVIDGRTRNKNTF